MNKLDLKPGISVLELENQELFLMCGDYLLSSNGVSYHSLSCYNNNLEDLTNPNYNVVKIYEIKSKLQFIYMLHKNNLTLVWERPRHLEFTNEQLNVLKALNYKYNYIARDKSTSALYAYQSLPLFDELMEHYESYDENESLAVLNHIFQEITPEHGIVDINKALREG